MFFRMKQRNICKKKSNKKENYSKLSPTQKKIKEYGLISFLQACVDLSMQKLPVKASFLSFAEQKSTAVIRAQAYFVQYQ